MADGNVLKSSATIDTGRPIVEVKAGLVAQLPDMDEKEIAYSVDVIAAYLTKNDNPKRIMLMRKEDSYFTLFENADNKSVKESAKAIYDFLTTDEYLVTVGTLKFIDVSNDYVEIWLGDKFFALFNFDGFAVML